VEENGKIEEEEDVVLHAKLVKINVVESNSFTTRTFQKYASLP